MLLIKPAHFFLRDHKAGPDLLVDDPESSQLIFNRGHLLGIVFIGRFAESSKAGDCILDLIIGHLDPTAFCDLNLEFSLDHSIDTHVVDLPEALLQLRPIEPLCALGFSAR